MNILLLFLLLQAEPTTKEPDYKGNQFSYIEPDLAPYVYSMVKDLRKSDIYLEKQKVLIIFANLSHINGILAIAHGTMDDDNVVIRIDETRWNKLTETQRHWLLWHEFGHDYFNVVHSKFAGIMYPTLPPSYTSMQVFEQYRNRFIKDIKNGFKKNRRFN